MNIEEFFSTLNHNEILIKLGIAFLIGTVLGLERGLKHKHASLKTAVVLTVASCMVTIVSIESALLYSSPYDRPMDPLRLAAQVINGISFIGAGIILAKNNNSVSGVTTAAIMWASVGFGISIGAGFYTLALTTLVFVIIGIEILPLLISKIGPNRLNQQQLKVRIHLDKNKEMTKVLKEMKTKEIKIFKVKVKDTDGNPKLDCIVLTDEKRYVTDIYNELKSLDGVISVEIESL